MDELKKTQRDAKIVLGGAVVYVIVSFLDWEQESIVGLTVGHSEWEGIGIVAGLLGFVLLAWELGRVLHAQFTLRTSKATTSVVLALLVALATLVTFLVHGAARHWPAWLGLGVALLTAAVAWVRGKREGVQFPAFGK